MERKNSNFNIRIDSDIREKFKELAKKEDMTASQLVRRWIREYVKKNEKKND